jgi:hypothetical protein
MYFLELHSLWDFFSKARIALFIGRREHMAISQKNYDLLSTTWCSPSGATVDNCQCVQYTVQLKIIGILYTVRNGYNT